MTSMQLRRFRNATGRYFTGDDYTRAFRGDFKDAAIMPLVESWLHDITLASDVVLRQTHFKQCQEHIRLRLRHAALSRSSS